jgi:hypothetical protein
MFDSEIQKTVFIFCYGTLSSDDNYPCFFLRLPNSWLKNMVKNQLRDKTS